jgi:S-adenosylmethionine-dependent methyltransferase
LSYINFDHLADRFQDQVYGSTKGRIRQAIIEASYTKALPELLAGHPLHVLDAGGGLGQMSQWMLELGHQVDYFDVSSEMLGRTQAKLAPAEAAGRWSGVRASILDYAPRHAMDLVIVHAVLEWLEQPQVALKRASQWLKPGGVLGLMVYNHHMLAMRNLMRGTLKKVQENRLGGDGQGLTPINPLDPGQVRGWLEDAGLDIRLQAGVRTFSDLTEPVVLSWYDEQDVIDMERQLCEQAPYRDLGRYVLFLARKKNRA